MNVIALLGVGVVAGVATSGLSVALLQARADDPSTAAMLTEDINAQDCIRAVPMESQRLLGFEGIPRLTARNQCEIDAGTRDVALLRRPVLSGGAAADLPIVARQLFEIRCGLLADPASDIVFSPEWLGVPQSCARIPTSGKGLSEVVLLTEENSLIEIRVFQLDVSSVDDLQQGIDGLARAAEVVW